METTLLLGKFWPLRRGENYERKADTRMQDIHPLSAHVVLDK